MSCQLVPLIGDLSDRYDYLNELIIEDVKMRAILSFLHCICYTCRNHLLLSDTIALIHSPVPFVMN